MPAEKCNIEGLPRRNAKSRAPAEAIKTRPTDEKNVGNCRQVQGTLPTRALARTIACPSFDGLDTFKPAERVHFCAPRVRGLLVVVVVDRWYDDESKIKTEVVPARSQSVGVRRSCV